MENCFTDQALCVNFIHLCKHGLRIRSDIIVSYWRSEFGYQGPVVRKVDSAIHRIVIFSTVVKMLEKL